MKLALTLTLRGLRHDWQGSLCFIAALVGVLAPLLVVLSLKNGVVGTMVERLVDDPSNRELLAVGAGSYGPEFFAEMAVRDDVDFLIPATRSINTVANALRNSANRRVERAVPLIPTAQGDPLLEGLVVTQGQAAISQKLAEALGVSTGDTLDMIIGRQIDGISENARADLQVIGIVSEQFYSRSALFIALPDLLAIERFRDDAAVSAETWRDTETAQSTYPSFRLYAQNLDDLTALEAEVIARGGQVRPRAENASLLLLFRKNLNILYAAIACIAAVGFWAAMAANLRGIVERQRVSYSLLDLLGLTEKARSLMPMFQSMILVGAGILVTLALVVPIILLINLGFASGPNQVIARLGVADLIGTIALGGVTAVTASLWAAIAIRNIETNEVLRHA